MKKMKKYSLIVFTIIICFTFGTVNIYAAKKVSYSYKKIDDSKNYSYGKLKNYFRYPKLKGSSNGIRKINNHLAKTGKKHIKRDGNSYSEIKSCLKRAYNAYGEKPVYYNIVEGTPSYNKNNIFSIMFASKWYMGGVYRQDIYGETFNTKTGKKLTIYQVVPKEYSSYNNLRKLIYDKLYLKKGSALANKFLEKYSSEKSIRDLDFYLNRNGFVLVCFRTYYLGSGGDGCIEVMLPSKF